MKLNIIPARHGALWVKLGIRTFLRQPLALSGLFFIFMAVLSLLSMFVGAVAAIGQKDIKRLMAYSSIAHMGFAPVSLDALQARSGLDSAFIQAQLLSLELEGFLARLPGGLFQRLAPN